MTSTNTTISSSAEVWREELGTAFGRLAPEAIGTPQPRGRMAGAQFGAIAAYRVSGTPQIVRRTPRAVRLQPIDLLKICVQLDGHATVCQDGREITVGPGQMAIYDTGRPYHLRLDGPWSCAVMAFSRDALSLPEHTVVAAMGHTYALTGGPGAVLAGFVSSAVAQRAVIGRGSAGRLGEAGLHLIAATLSDAATCAGDDAAEATRLQILGYVRAHLAEPDLTHARVAAAHHMAGRTLHRLFADEPQSVADYIRTRRLEAAMRDLRDPLLAHRSIAGIAAHWCFIGQAHFTRAFHARYGMTPSAARRAAAPDAARSTE